MRHALVVTVAIAGFALAGCNNMLRNDTRGTLAPAAFERTPGGNLVPTEEAVAQEPGLDQLRQQPLE